MAEWSVLIEAQAPPDGEADETETIEAAIEMAELLADYSPAPAATGRTWSIRMAVEAQDATYAADKARQVVDDYLGKAGLPAWPVVHTEATRWDLFEAELEKPAFPDLVGSQEVAEMLGVSRQRLHELRSSGRFPQPMVTLAATPVWLRTAVEAFLETWERRPGRRTKVVAYFERAGSNGWVVTLPDYAGSFHYVGQDPPPTDELRSWIAERVGRDTDVELRPRVPFSEP